MPISKPTKSLVTNNLKNLLKCKFHAYYAVGVGEAAAMPAHLVDALALYAEEPFVPLGDLHKDPVTVKYAYDTEELNSGTHRSVLSVTCEIKGAFSGQDMIDMLDDGDLDGTISILLVPFKNPGAVDIGATNPARFVLLNGVQVRHTGKGNANNKFGEFTIIATAEPNKIGDVIKLWSFTD